MRTLISDYTRHNLFLTTSILLVVYALSFFLQMEKTKLTAQSTRCAFLGYAPYQKGFICYDSIAKRTLISHNVVFLENQYFSKTTQNHWIPTPKFCYPIFLTKQLFLGLNLICVS